MEGINMSGPFNQNNNFEITNIKNYEELMNLNSLDGDKNKRINGDGKMAYQETDGDFVSEGEHSHRTQQNMMG